MRSLLAASASSTTGSSDPLVVTLARRPARALVLAVLSRVVLAALIATVAWSIVSALRPPAEGAVVVAPAPVERPDGAPKDAVDEGPGLSLVDLVAVLPDGGGTATPPPRVVELVLGPPRAGLADVRLVVLAPATDGDAVAMALEALRLPGIEGLRVRSVVAAPEGARLELDGRARLSSARLPDVAAAAEDRTSTALAALVAASDASLVRLDLPDASGSPVRMTIRGGTGALVAVAGGLERGFTSPQRLVAVRLAEGRDGVHELQVAFGLRVAPSASAARAGAQEGDAA